MTNTNQLILDLISKNASVNEITSITGLSAKQLFHRMNMLKIKGYDFKRKYYYNGDVCYDLVKNLNKEKTNETTILTSKKDTEFKALLISDLHLGNSYNRPDLLNEVYNFCIKNGINIIINAGDLIDGPENCGNRKQKQILDLESQIEYLLKVYPYDKSILNFICLGNHDYACLKTEGLDLHKIFENKRHDLISLGYGKGIINIKNDKLAIFHPTEIEYKNPNNELMLRLHGHSHKSKNQVYYRDIDLWIPSLTDLDVQDNNESRKNFPSMILATMSFHKSGHFEIGNFEQFIFIGKEIYKVNEFESYLLNGKNTSKTTILNIEERKGISEKDIDSILNKNLQPVIKKDIVKEEKVKEKTLELSPIEKFNKKWNRK